MIHPSLSAKPRDIVALTTKPSMHKSSGDISNPNQNISIHITSPKESPRASGELNPSIWEARGCKLEFKLGYIRDLKINYLNKPRIPLLLGPCSIWSILVFTHPLTHASFLKPSQCAVTHRAVTHRSMCSHLWIFLPTLPCVRVSKFIL